MDRTQEREALDALLRSEGWQIFTEHVRDEWGPLAFRRRMNLAIYPHARTTDGQQAATMNAMEVETATRQIEVLISWVATRITQLEAGEETPQPDKGERRQIERPAPREVRRPA
jgi:hypothetical protein